MIPNSAGLNMSQGGQWQEKTLLKMDVCQCSTMALGNDAKLGDDKYDMWMISWLK